MSPKAKGGGRKKKRSGSHRKKIFEPVSQPAVARRASVGDEAKRSGSDYFEAPSGPVERARGVSFLESRQASVVRFFFLSLSRTHACHAPCRLSRTRALDLFHVCAVCVLPS